MKARKVLLILIAVALIIGMTPVSGLAAGTDASRGFSDMPADWSTLALQNAVDNGLLVGAGGKLNPKGNLTRAEMATIISRVFNAQVKGDLSAYTDVKAGEWYADYLAKAYQMQVMQGAGGLMKPQMTISREEVFVIVARALKLEPASSWDKSFSDAGSLAAWSKGEAAALVNAGYLQGADGKLNPQANITRAEFAQLMYNVIPHYIQQAGKVSKDYVGNLMINRAGVTLENSQVTGDLIIGDGVGSGDITLDGVTVTGRLLVRGGGVNSIYIKGDSTIENLIIARVDGQVRVVNESGKEIGVVVIDGSDNVVLVGKFGTVTVLADDITVDATEATIGKIVAEGSNAVVEEKPVDSGGGGTVVVPPIDPPDPPITIDITSISISGTAKVGETLTATDIDPSGASVDYQWYRYETNAEDSARIKIGSNSNTYPIHADDIGGFIRVEVIGKDGYKGTVLSGATVKVEKAVVEITGYDAIADLDGGKEGAATYATAADVKAALPTTVTITGTSDTVAVTWSEDSTPTYAITEGEYVFTGTIGALPEGYVDAVDPIATVTAKVVIGAAAPVLVEITGYDAIADLDGGKEGAATYATAADVKAALPTTVTITGTSDTVAVTWSEDSAPEYAITEGTYEFTGTIGTLPAGYVDDVDPITTVTAKVVIEAAGPIEITGYTALTEVTLNADENLMDLAALKASGKLPTTVEVTDGTTPTNATITDWTGTFDGTSTGAQTLTAVWTKPVGYVDAVDPITVTITVNVNTAQTELAPSAAVDDVTVDALHGYTVDYAQDIVSKDIKITLTNATFKEIAADSDLRGWFNNNLPTGLEIKNVNKVNEGDTNIIISVSGTPSKATKKEAMDIKIPANVLNIDVDLEIAKNNNAVFDFAKYAQIAGVMRDLNDLSISGLAWDDVNNTLIMENFVGKSIATIYEAPRQGYKIEKILVKGANNKLTDDFNALSFRNDLIIEGDGENAKLEIAILRETHNVARGIDIGTPSSSNNLKIENLDLDIKVTTTHANEDVYGIYYAKEIELVSSTLNVQVTGNRKVYGIYGEVKVLINSNIDVKVYSNADESYRLSQINNNMPRVDGAYSAEIDAWISTTNDGSTIDKVIEIATNVKIESGDGKLKASDVKNGVKTVHLNDKTTISGEQEIEFTGNEATIYVESTDGKFYKFIITRDPLPIHETNFTVKNESDIGVENVSIALNSGTPVLTNANGEATFSNVATGNVTVTLSYLGGTNNQLKNIVVTKSDNTTVEVEEVTAGSIYTFEMPANDVTVAVTVGEPKTIKIGTTGAQNIEIKLVNGTLKNGESEIAGLSWSYFHNTLTMNNYNGSGIYGGSKNDIIIKVDGEKNKISGSNAIFGSFNNGLVITGESGAKLVIDSENWGTGLNAFSATIEVQNIQFVINVHANVTLSNVEGVFGSITVSGTGMLEINVEPTGKNDGKAIVGVSGKLTLKDSATAVIKVEGKNGERVGDIFGAVELSLEGTGNCEIIVIDANNSNTGTVKAVEVIPTDIPDNYTVTGSWDSISVKYIYNAAP